MSVSNLVARKKLQNRKSSQLSSQDLLTDPFDRPRQWLFLGKKAGEPMGRYTEQNIYYSALKKSGVRRKSGIHPLRHYPEFRTIQGKCSKLFVHGLGAASVCRLTRHSPHVD